MNSTYINYITLTDEIVTNYVAHICLYNDDPDITLQIHKKITNYVLNNDHKFIYSIIPQIKNNSLLTLLLSKLDKKILLDLAKEKQMSQIWHHLIEYLPETTDIEIYKSMIEYTASHNDSLYHTDDLCSHILDKLDDKKKISELIYEKFHKIGNGWGTLIIYRILDYIPITDEIVAEYINFPYYDQDYTLIIDYIINKDIDYMSTIAIDIDPLLRAKLLEKLSSDIISILIINILSSKKLEDLPEHYTEYIKQCINYLSPKNQLKIMIDYGGIILDIIDNLKAIIEQFSDEDISNLILIYSDAKLGRIARDVLRSR